MKRLLSLGALCAIFASGAAMADTQSQAVNIEWPTSQTGLIATVSFTLPAIASIDAVGMDLAHSWAGDIGVNLIAPDTTVYDVNSGNGGSADLGDGLGYLLGNTVAYEWVAPGTTGNLLGGGNPIPGGQYDAENFPAGAAAGGMWTIELFDNAGGDGGAVGDIWISYTLPAPGALALLGLAGVVAPRRRRH